MSHQPFDTWIFQNDLTSAEQQELESHLLICPECKGLQQNLQNFESCLKTTPMVAPKTGFTARWQNDLVLRKALQQKRLIRRLLLLLCAAALTVLALLIPVTVVTLSPAAILSNFLITLGNLLVDIRMIAFHFLQFVQAYPVILFIAVWIAATGIMLPSISLWGYSIWRIAIQGVNNK